MLRSVVVALSMLTALIATGVASADEAKTSLSAAMILNIVSAPVDTRASSYDAGLKESIARPVDSFGGEVLPDGSVRYGRTIVTVRNPCPPGEHLEPLTLPGRRR